MKAGLQKIDLILVMNVETLSGCCRETRVEIKQKKKKIKKNLPIQGIVMQFEVLSGNQFNSFQLYLYNSSSVKDYRRN